jgi:hypothetical protein
MKRIGYSLLSAFALATIALTANLASATTPPNGAVITTRIYNDCPSSTLSSTNLYPALINIHDANLTCFGFANRHAWSFSADGGATPEAFRNRDEFSFAATVQIDGSSNGESGLRLSPWYSPDNDGSFNIRTPDGEIACFGGRLPFYSFTASQGISYAKGTPIRLQIDYMPNDVSATNPGTIVYTVKLGVNTYVSPVLAFDHANPAEDPPHGVWGILNDARAGGHIQALLGNGNDVDLQSTWTDITFEAGPTAVRGTTWGKIKSDYR